MNKTQPQRNGAVATFDSTKSSEEERGRTKGVVSAARIPLSSSKGCDFTCVCTTQPPRGSTAKTNHWQPCSARVSCTGRCVCISATILLVLAAAVALAVALGLLLQVPVNRFCTASSNQTGFLCNDRETCIPASQVCDSISNCRRGEDEQEKLCGNLPHSLPGFLVFHCSNPRSWVYADQRCDGMNDCGDCSDEMGSLAACPPCRSQWWSCSSVFYEYCSCIPRRLCRDGVQHCLGWSDEYLCTP